MTTIDIQSAIDMVSTMEEITEGKDITSAGNFDVDRFMEGIGEGAKRVVIDYIIKMRDTNITGEETWWEKYKREKSIDPMGESVWKSSLVKFLRAWWVGNELHLGYSEIDFHPDTGKEMSGVARHMHLGSEHVKPRPFLNVPEVRKGITKSVLEDLRTLLNMVATVASLR